MHEDSHAQPSLCSIQLEDNVSKERKSFVKSWASPLRDSLEYLNIDSSFVSSFSQDKLNESELKKEPKTQIISISIELWVNSKEAKIQSVGGDQSINSTRPFRIKFSPAAPSDGVIDAAESTGNSSYLFSLKDNHRIIASDSEWEVYNFERAISNESMRWNISIESTLSPMEQQYSSIFINHLEINQICAGEGILDQSLKLNQQLIQANSDISLSYQRNLAVNYCVRPACDECLNQSICSKCVSPFVNVHGECILCGKGLKRSSNLGDAYCKKIITPKGCSNYNMQTSSCDGCFSGFQINNNCQTNESCNGAPKYLDQSDKVTCKKCSDSITNCQQCATGEQCSSCKASNYLSISNYSSATPSVTCVSACASGYFIDEDNQCAPCGMNCKTCVKGSRTCSACMTGFELDTVYNNANPTLRMRCIPIGSCPANCVTCSGSSCVTCESGYAAVGGACQKCGVGCLTCTDSVTCTLCSNGSTITPICASLSCNSNQFVNGSQICENCLLNCAQCQNGLSCQTCNPTYVVDGNTCAQCPSNCAVCSDKDNCASCNGGYHLNTSTGQCDLNLVTCAANEYVVGSECKPCNSQCNTCSSANFCTACVNGNAPNKGLCVTCASSLKYVDTNGFCQFCGDNCQGCKDLLGCIACKDGYFFDISAKKCIKISLCGDGNMDFPIIMNDAALLAKQCDDRNLVDNDGCSSTCQIEAGYVCTYSQTAQISNCEKPKVLDSNKRNSFKLKSKKNRDNQNTIIVVRFEYAIQSPSKLGRALGIVEASSASPVEQYFRDSLAISIQDIPADQYSYTVSVHSDIQGCDMEFITSANIVEKSVIVTLKGAFKDANNVSNDSAEMDFPTTKFVSEEQKQASQAAATTAQVIGSSFIGSVLPVIIFSNFSLLFNALDLFQMIFYLQYVNIRLPYNVQEFLYIMTNFQLPISLNFIAYFYDENPVESPIVPKPFEDGEMSGVFLENTGDSYSQIIILAVSHLILVGFTKVCRKSTSDSIKKSGAFIEGKLKSSWEFGWYLDMYWEMYLSFVVGCMLQFYAVTFDDIQSAINSVVFLFSLIVTILSPCVFFGIIRKNQRKLEEIEIKDKWGMLYETLKVENHSVIHPEAISKVVPSIKGIETEIKSVQLSHMQFVKQDKNKNNYVSSKETISANYLQEKGQQSSTNNIIPLESSQSSLEQIPDLQASSMNSRQNRISSVISKYFFVGLYVRKFFFGIFIVALWDSPLMQLIILDMLNLLILIFLIAAQPFEKQSHTYKSIICEMFMVIAQCSLKFLINDPADEEESFRLKMGWIFIVCCIGILFVQMLFILASLFIDIREKLRQFREKNRKKSLVQKLPSKESVVNIEIIEEYSFKNGTRNGKKNPKRNRKSIDGDLEEEEDTIRELAKGNPKKGVQVEENPAASNRELPSTNRLRVVTSFSSKQQLESNRFILQKETTSDLPSIKFKDRVQENDLDQFALDSPKTVVSSLSTSTNRILGRKVLKRSNMDHVFKLTKDKS